MARNLLEDCLGRAPGVMRASIHDLPPPPSGLTGWPWTEAATEPRALPAVLPDGSSWPSIGIVTPSMNQAAYLEATIRSVLLQGYPRLCYVVMDGGSTDGSVEIIRRYEPWIDSWVSEPDQGQYDAIGKGFERCPADIMAWLNSDDLYLPGALRTIGEVFSRYGSVEWISTTRPARIVNDGQWETARPLPGFSGACFWRGEYVVGIRPLWSGWIPQEATFWRSSLWQRAGGHLSSELDLAGDFELWTRFAGQAELYGLEAPLAAFRLQPEQKTAVALDRYKEEAREVFRQMGGRANSHLRAFLRLLVSRAPARARALAGRLGLSEQAQVITRAGGDGAGPSWRIETTWV